MSTRIRYSKDGKSVRAINGFFVQLDVAGKSFSITDGTGTVVHSGTGPSSSSLKIKAKKALEGLGVMFDNETRKKDKPNA